VITEKKGVKAIPLSVITRSNDRGAWVASTECSNGLQRKADFPFA
jgi:hypothetical protein